jgi:hypothetical protein
MKHSFALNFGLRCSNLRSCFASRPGAVFSDGFVRFALFASASEKYFLSDNSEDDKQRDKYDVFCIDIS